MINQRSFTTSIIALTALCVPLVAAAQSSAGAEHPSDSFSVNRDAPMDEVNEAGTRAMNAYNAGDMPAARQAFTEACALGLGEACSISGSMYERGDGGPVDLKFASVLYYSGCFDAPDDTKSANACEGMGRATREGWGGQPNLAYSNLAFSLGCELGNGKACFESGNIALRRDPPDLREAVGEFMRGCDQQSAGSCYAMGILIRRVGIDPPQGATADDFFNQACQLNREYCE